jgi:AcrR family transcriptional regulator
VPAAAASKPGGSATDESGSGGGAPPRRRILDSAFAAFTEAGYAGTSTLEIARRARVSKRELYALVGNKQEMLAACIRERAERLQVPVDLPAPVDRPTLERVLVAVGAQLLAETTTPTVIAVFRLAIAEAVRAPGIAQVLDSAGRRAGRAALIAIMAAAADHGVLDGPPAEAAEQFAALLWGDLMISLLLGAAEAPDHREVQRRAGRAAVAFLRLHPDAGPPDGGTGTA